MAPGPWPPGHLCFLVQGALRQLSWHVTTGLVCPGCEGRGKWVWGLWEMQMLTMDGMGPPTAVVMEGPTIPGHSTQTTWPGLRCLLCPGHLTVWQRCDHRLFTPGETEAQRGEVVWPRPHSWEPTPGCTGKLRLAMFGFQPQLLRAGCCPL